MFWSSGPHTSRMSSCSGGRPHLCKNLFSTVLRQSYSGETKGAPHRERRVGNQDGQKIKGFNDHFPHWPHTHTHTYNFSKYLSQIAFILKIRRNSIVLLINGWFIFPFLYIYFFLPTAPQHWMSRLNGVR